MSPHRLALVAVLFVACAAPQYNSAKAPRFVPPPARPGLVHTEGNFIGARGVRLFEQAWRPSAEPKAVLVVMHGLKDHSSRYAPLAERLVAGGFAVHAFDLRGHGYSEGRRVWVDDFADYIADLGAFVESVRQREPGKPIFVLGHSMGGAIVTLYALGKPDVRGILLSAPALAITPDVTPFLMRATRWLGRSNPRIAVFKLPNKNFSSDPKRVDEMDRDPAIYQGAGPAHTAAEVLGAIERIQREMGSLALPLLAMHGTADKVTNPEGSKQLVARAQSSDKTLKLYDGYFHDLLHEPGAARVIEDVAAWLDARVAPPGS